MHKGSASCYVSHSRCQCVIDKPSKRKGSCDSIDVTACGQSQPLHQQQISPRFNRGTRPNALTCTVSFLMHCSSNRCHEQTWRVTQRPTLRDGHPMGCKSDQITSQSLTDTGDGHKGGDGQRTSWMSRQGRTWRCVHL